MGPTAVFLIHLLQDVHVLRPLIFMAARDFEFETQLLVSDRFRARDTTGIWLREIESISAESGAVVHYFGDDWQARSRLTGHGLLFSASESHIRNHAIAHNVFRHAPAGYMRVTVQHGFECVGFRHGADHVRSFGETASFAADIVCAWYGRDQLTALAPSQAPKLLVTGPTSVLQMANGDKPPPGGPGLVCENLHSVRFESAHKLQHEFLLAFRCFAAAMDRQGRNVLLRPHPGGQYSAQANAGLAPGVELENAPLYRLDLRQFSYGISPPSSVLIDLLLADIPTAVWRDRRGRIDVGNYEGLVTVTTAEELISFAQDAERNRERLVAHQHRWLERQGMPLEPAEVYERFAKLFETAERMTVRPPGSQPERERILVVTDDAGPIQPELESALAALGANGAVSSEIVTGQQFGPHQDGGAHTDSSDAAVEGSLEAYGPSVIFLCGQDVKSYRTIIRWAKREQVPAIYFFDVDAAGRISPGGSSGREFEETLSGLLHEVEVIYAPTKELKALLERAFPKLRTAAGSGLPQDPDRGHSLSAFRDELLRMIALGHAAVIGRHREAQKEARICHAR